MPEFDISNCKLCATEAVRDHIEYGLNYALLLERFAKKDWGNISAEDSVRNEKSLVTKERIFAAYDYGSFIIWIILAKDHQKLTLLLPDEF